MAPALIQGKHEKCELKDRIAWSQNRQASEREDSFFQMLRCLKGTFGDPGSRMLASNNFRAPTARDT